MTGIATDAVFVTVFTLLTVFTISYWIIAPWYRSPAGRALMVMSTGFWLMTLAQVLRHPFGLSTTDSLAFAWLQIGAAAVAGTGIAWITSVLIRAQWRGRRTYFQDIPDGFRHHRGES